MSILASSLLLASAVSTHSRGVEPAVRVGNGGSSSLVYIDFGPHTFWFDVRYDNSITGFAALQLIDDGTNLEMESLAFGGNQFVTSLSLGGYAQTGQGVNGNDYWSYWRRDAANWSLSGIGASVRMLHSGQSDGWVWTAAQTWPPDAPRDVYWDRIDASISNDAFARRASSSVPEPACAAFAFLASAVLSRRRRRHSHISVTVCPNRQSSIVNVSRLLPNPPPAYRERGPGFTLVELLVVIGIIAILFAALLPTMKNATEQSRSVQCLSNLRQMMIAAHAYISDNRGAFPLSQYSSNRPPDFFVDYKWDFTRVNARGAITQEAGMLWAGRTSLAVQQCPSFDGKSVGYNDEPFTGYNYNVSFVGGEPGALHSAKASQIRRPSETVVFGDGQYSAGANKFMRSPFPSPHEIGRDSFFVTGGRYAGTQAFRHRGRSNAAFADGHAAGMAKRYTQTVSADANQIAPGTGFLSSDNSLYDLE